MMAVSPSMASSIAAGSASHHAVVATLRTSTPNSWLALSNDGCAVIGNTMFGRVVGRRALNGRRVLQPTRQKGALDFGPRPAVLRERGGVRGGRIGYALHGRLWHV